jgi:hypothetical protein
MEHIRENADSIATANSVCMGLGEPKRIRSQTNSKSGVRATQKLASI